MSPEGTSVPILLYNLILIILYAQSARKVSQTGNLYFDVPGDKFVQFLYNFDFLVEKNEKKYKKSRNAIQCGPNLMSFTFSRGGRV